jgi:hypothetical protein
VVLLLLLLQRQMVPLPAPQMLWFVVIAPRYLQAVTS